MSEISELPFQSLIDALLDEATPFDPKYLYRLSDLDQEDLTLFLDTWPRLSLLRRRALVEDLQELGLAENLLSFKSIGQNVISDEDPHVRLLAAQILWEFEDTDLIPFFLQLLDSDPEAEIRAAAASGLGKFVFFGEIDRLHGEKLLEIEDRLLAVIWSLSEIGGESARHTLERLFQEMEDDQEADFLESALDNIAFTDGLQPFSLVDYPEESPEDDLLEMLISQEGYLDDNGNGDLNLVEDEDDEHILDNAEYDNEDQDYYD